MAIGEEIRKLRESKGLSQEKFGALFGASQSKVQRIESGTNDFDLQEVKKICDRYSLNAEAFVMNEKVLSKNECGKCGLIKTQNIDLMQQLILCQGELLKLKGEKERAADDDNDEKKSASGPG